VTSPRLGQRTQGYLADDLAGTAGSLRVDRDSDRSDPAWAAGRLESQLVRIGGVRVRHRLDSRVAAADMTRRRRPKSSGAGREFGLRHRFYCPSLQSKRISGYEGSGTNRPRYAENCSRHRLPCVTTRLMIMIQPCAIQRRERQEFTRAGWPI